MNKNLNKEFKKVLAKSMALFVLGGAGALSVVSNSEIQVSAAESEMVIEPEGLQLEFNLKTEDDNENNIIELEEENSSSKARSSMTNSLGNKKGTIRNVGKGYRLNVRKGPGTSSKCYPVGQVVDGTRFTLISESKGWYKVLTDTSTKNKALIGYISKDFAKLDANPVSNNNAAFYVTVKKTDYLTNKNGTIKYNTVKKGTKLLVTNDSKSKDRYKVWFTNSKGNTSHCYIKKTSVQKI